MSDVFVKIAPVVLTFLLGVLLRKTHVLTKENADLFLKVFFYVSLPALILLSIPHVTFSFSFAVMPLIASSIVLINYGVAFFFGRFLKLERRAFGVFLIGSVIMNGGFIFPFVFSAYGPEGMAIATLFDFGNALVVLSFVYYLACKYGRESDSQENMLLKFAKSPPLWALFVAIVLNVTNWEIPNFGIGFLQILGGMTTPLMMMSLGIYFNHRVVNIAPLLSVIFVRMGVGLFLGVSFIGLLNLEGLFKVIVLLMSCSPAGINTLTYSSMEHLDKEFAASVVSYSTLIGIFLVPLILFLVNGHYIAT